MNQRNLAAATNLKKRNLVLGLIGTAGALNGFLTACFYGKQNLVNFVEICFALIAICLIYFWIYYDAQARSFKNPKLIRYLIILIGIIGVPVYFWKTRSLKNFCLNLGGLWLFMGYSLIYYGSFFVAALVFTKLGYYSSIR